MILNVLCALAIAGAALLAELAIRRALSVVAEWRMPSLPKMPSRPKRPATSGGQFMAYLLLTGGTAATIAANYAHAEANIGAKALSAVVPALLFVAFHIAAGDGRWHIRLGTAAVAILCFAISYDHISELARSYGESKVSAVLYPLAIDGAMIIATFVLSRKADTADAVLSAPAPVAAPKPVRPKPAVLSAPEPALSPVPPAVPEDKVRTNGFDRPMPPKQDRTAAPVRADNEARLEAARKIVENLGGVPSRPVLVTLLKDQGFRISSQAAADLVRELKVARQEARS